MTLDGLPLFGLTAPALLGVTVLLLLLGRIVPRSTLMDKIAEAERWRQAYETERQARELANKQTVELLEVTKLTNDIVVAAFGRDGVIQKRGGANDVPPKT